MPCPISLIKKNPISYTFQIVATIRLQNQRRRPLSRDRGVAVTSLCLYVRCTRDICCFDGPGPEARRFVAYFIHGSNRKLRTNQNNFLPKVIILFSN